MNFNSIIYMDNTKHHIKDTSHDITWVSMMLWMILTAIWLGWWDIYLYDGYRHNLYSSLNIITLDRGEASEVTDLLLKPCAWSKISQRHHQIAIDEPTWSDGLHIW